MVEDDVLKNQLGNLCREYHIQRLELFGSRAKGDHRLDSDIDLMVTFEDGKTPGMAFFSLPLILKRCLVVRLIW